MKYFLLLFVLLSITSCLENTGALRSKVISANTDDTINATATALAMISASPTANTDSKPYSYFQNGSQIATGSLVLNYTFNDSFYLRGNDIHKFLEEGSNRITRCMVVTFASIKKTLILSLNPKFFLPPGSQTKEYYFHIYSTESNINTSSCQKPALLHTLANPTPEAGLSLPSSQNQVLPSDTSFVYEINQVCPNGVSSCPGRMYSTPVKIYTADGKLDTFSALNLNYLNIVISVDSTNEQRSGVFCDRSEACISYGFQCCLDGQCVNDKTLKPGVDITSAAYLQAKKDIESNPMKIRDYPEIFYVCSKNISATPVGDIYTPTAFHEEASNLKELYDCTVPEYDEVGICTVSYEHASTPRPGPFYTDADDRTFFSTYMGSDAGTENSKLPLHSIYEVVYGGITLYNLETQNTPIATELIIDSNSYNDTLTDKQKIFLYRSLSTINSSSNDTLKIRFKVDGSCISLNDTLAKCTKTYYQSQDVGKTSDHLATESKYNIPYYADLTKQISVSVDGYQTRADVDWTLTTSTSSYIEFIPYDPENKRGVNVFDNQRVDISFFVDTASYNVNSSKKAAQKKISDYCNCGNQNCLLKKEYGIENGQSVVKGYICEYPTPDTGEVPVQINLNVNAKAAPIRFYSSLGQAFDIINPGTPLPSQEGNLFEYLSVEGQVSYTRPNNAFTDSETYGEKYIGFNEIYGSIINGNLLGTNAPKMVKVKEGRLYDIFTNTGSYSPCNNCGNDYYSTMNKMFPDNFKFMGGGYMPDPRRTNREGYNSGIEGNYRSDELLFGRACFVPATMIPWSHQKRSSMIEQRKYRLAVQHTLFANGYQRDWYGFDYGALIGSFDGVTWFAIGNARRVKATTNKLFLAINGYFSDLATTNNTSVTIKETTGIMGSGTNITTDFQNDGAECQKYHLCDKDKDCITQLGWEYSCQSIADIQTNWPYFDINANEIPNSERNYRLINLLIGGSSGVNKRCVYRGRGAPCAQNYFTINSNQSYAGNSVPGLHACLPNYYCQKFVNDDGTFASFFNTRIARYGRSVQIQNKDELISAADPTEEFGLGSRVIGRPYKYNSDQQVDSQYISQLSYNKVTGLCIPGKDVTDGTYTYERQNRTRPTNTSFMGDKVLGIGMSYSFPNFGARQALSSCSILDMDGNYIHNQITYKDLPLNGNGVASAAIPRLSGNQAFSTNLLEIFQQTNQTDKMLIENNVPLTRIAYQENRCLRAPGSPCFSDFDCGPNAFISKQISSINPISTSYNIFEYLYWTEALVCGQLRSKTDSKYNLKENTCCRQSGNVITISGDPNTVNTSNIASIDFGTNSNKRYSRIAPLYYYSANTHPFYKEIVPTLAVPTAADNCGIDPTAWTTPTTTTCLKLSKSMPQFVPIHEIASKTCCSKHWVRNFNSDISTGHKWDKSIHQTIDKANLKCVNFDITSATPDDGQPFACPTPVGCNIHNFTDTEVIEFSNFLGSLELLGIPQVAIKSTHHSISLEKSVGCFVVTKNADGTLRTADNWRARPRAMPTVTYLPDIPIPGTIKIAYTGFRDLSGSPRPTAIPEFITEDNTIYFSAGDKNNFEDSLKNIFSATSFSCCLPVGSYSTDIVNNKTGAQLCCTGNFVQEEGNSALARCCLPSYTNVSLYLSRYISSEAGELSPSLFDPYTGILPPSTVLQIVKDKNICCSGSADSGKAISKLPLPGLGEANTNANEPRRFVYLDTDSTVNYYDEVFQRWNLHIYCVPKQ
ncbi:MAG: hypothetical protein HQK49_01735 [Oligoflexia bacterium]|nr:hypothetical protein [Oligoflexia bacterium]